MGRSSDFKTQAIYIIIAVCLIVDRNNHSGTIATRAEVDIVGSLVPYAALLIILYNAPSTLRLCTWLDWAGKKLSVEADRLLYVCEMWRLMSSNEIDSSTYSVNGFANPVTIALYIIIIICNYVQNYVTYISYDTV